MNTIIIKGLEVFAYHGVNPEEKRDGQRFVLDITLTADLSRAEYSDDLNDTVNYAAVRKTVTRLMCDNTFDLIERAAACVADGIMAEHERVQGVDIMLKKPDAPMSAKFEYVAVTVSRKRG